MEPVKKFVGKRKILLFGFVFGSRSGQLVQVVWVGSDLCYREEISGGRDSTWSDLGLCLVAVFAFGFSGFARDGLLGL